MIRDVSGNATGFVAVVRDITERKQAEKQSWLTWRRSRNKDPNPIVEVSLGGDIQYMNPTATPSIPGVA